MPIDLGQPLYIEYPSAHAHPMVLLTAVVFITLALLVFRAVLLQQREVEDVVGLVGVPARVLRNRFEPEIQEAFLRIAW